jgi:hypothetical protein
MKEGGHETRRRGEKLLRWYPAEWRARYGDEFGELLAAEIAEQPRSFRRSVDVAVGGIMARLADAGLAGTTIKPSEQPRRSLATFGCALTVFLAFAASIWSQLIIARRSSEPTTSATHKAIVIMSIALFSCVAAALIGAMPVAWKAAVTLARRRVPELRRPALLFLTGTAVLIAGGLHFRTGWAGSGTTPWTHQAMGLGGAGALMWASTLAVSAYWAHPTILLSFPPSEIAWMVVSPAALIVAVTGAAQTVRRLDLSGRLLRFANGTARVALAALGLFMFGAFTWIVDGGPGPNNLFQPGTVDLLAMAVMTATLALAVLSVHRTAATSPITPSSLSSAATTRPRPMMRSRSSRIG